MDFTYFSSEHISLKNSASGAVVVVVVREGGFAL